MSIATDLVDAFRPWMTDDLRDYLEAMGSMFSETELYAISEEDDELGWSILFDPDLCPAQALPYLAQFVGEQLPVGITEADAREWIKDAPNQRRGTLESVVRVAQRSLTGDRIVQVRQRSGSDPILPEDQITVQTYTTQTPSAEQVRRDLEADAVPYDITLNMVVLPGQTWADVNADNANWAAVAAANPTWLDLQGRTPGYNIYTRPRAT